jgi:Winged helix DNA-binding domain
VIEARFTAQLLSGRPARSAEEVVHRLLSVQAQDARGARLAIRSRSVGLRSADVDAALTERRSLVISWLNRGTLQLVDADDYWWLHPLTTPQLATGNRRRLVQEGVSAKQAERGVDAVVDAVRSNGPQTRRELRGLLDAAGVPTAGQALVHVLFAASIRGAIVRGPMLGTEHAFVSVSDWLGDPPEPIERATALARLARRYLAGHGPADARDLAKWAGVTLGDARAALENIRVDLVELPGGLVDLAYRGRLRARPRPRLLGPFDPLLLGWVSREAVVGGHRNAVTANGLFRACALVDGRVVGTWGSSGAVLTLSLLEDVDAASVEALRRDAADVFRFLGLPPGSEVVVDRYGSGGRG